jgi:hypothetical protein
MLIELSSDILVMSMSIEIIINLITFVNINQILLSRLILISMQMMLVNLILMNLMC